MSNTRITNVTERSLKENKHLIKFNDFFFVDLAFLKLVMNAQSQTQKYLLYWIVRKIQNFWVTQKAVINNITRHGN
jgi:hypothetical protein